MASVTGTLTAVGQQGASLYLRAGETCTVAVSRTGVGAWAAQLVTAAQSKPSVFTVVETFQANASGYTFVNQTDNALLVAVQLRQIQPAESVSFTIADVVGDQILEEWRAADGTLAFRITDQGPVGGIVGSTLDVRAFGAVGDGVTDDTAAIQAALDACDAAGGGVVFAPEGTYAFTQLNIRVNVTLAGAGQQVTTFRRSALGPGDGTAISLFGIRLRGDFAGLRDCSVSGLWDPADPTTQTFDFNVAVVGDGTSHTLTQNVETYNAHIGYAIGGVIADPASYASQNYNRVVGCYAHDTYDLGFAFVAKGRADADTSVHNSLIDCNQEDSYATGGLEIRYQRATQVVRFNSRNNTNSTFGCAIRLEEVSWAQITNVQSTGNYFGIQCINDSEQCVVSGLTTRAGTYGIWMRNCANLQFSDVVMYEPNRDGMLLEYTDGTSWLLNNENITLDGFDILRAGTLQFAYGIFVRGDNRSDARLADNGKGLVVRNGRIRESHSNGIVIQAGGDFLIENVSFEDNGVGAGIVDGAGIVVLPPAPGGVSDLNKPANGWIEGCTFLTTGSQPFTIGAWSGNQIAKPSVGTIRLIGNPSQPNYRWTAVEPGSIVQRGVQAQTRGLAFADSPVTVLTRDYSLVCTAAAGNVVLNLPAASAHPSGVYVIKKTDATANTVTVTPNGAETIDGAGTLVLTAQNQARTIQSNGTTWRILGAYL